MAIKLSSKMPGHIAVNCRLDELSALEDFDRALIHMQGMISTGFKLNIPVLSFFLLREDSPTDAQKIDGFERFFNALSEWDFLQQNQVKITVLGKWYGMPGRLVDAVKKLIEKTKDFDRFFLNLCLNYDGQSEIVDACRILAKQVKVGKLDPESITKALMKENCYSSYFIPPDMVLLLGRKTEGFLLWDSSNARICFSGKTLASFDEDDLLLAVREWQGL